MERACNVLILTPLLRTLRPTFVLKGILGLPCSNVLLFLEVQQELWNVILLFLGNLAAPDQVVHKFLGVNDHGDAFCEFIGLKLFWIHAREVVERAKVVYVIVEDGMVFPRHVFLQGLQGVKVLVALQTLLERKYSELNETNIPFFVCAVLFVRN